MAIYSRKTFIAVAEILNQFVNDIDEVTFEDLVDEFGDLFSADNPNFDIERFRTECVK